MAFAAVLSLSACGPAQPTPAPSPTATSTPSSQPSAEPTPEPTLTSAEPVQAFGGDCTQVFSDGELSDTFSTPMTDLGVNWSIGQEEALGGLKCTWWSEGFYLGAVVHLVALPASAAPDSVTDTTSCRSEYCEATVLTSQGWYSIVVDGYMTTGDPRVVEELLAKAGERGDALPAATIPPTASGVWERPTPGCADLGASLASPSGSPVTVEDSFSDDESALGALQATLGNWCYFTVTAPDEQGTTLEAFFAVALVPGGAIAFDAGVKSGRGEPVQLANGEAAEVIMPFVAEGNPGIFATDGTNTIAVSTPLGFTTTDFTWVAEQLLDALNS